MSNVIMFRAPSGVAGSITRQQDTKVESVILDQTDYPSAFGVPLVYDTGKFRKFMAGDTSALITGELCRTVPSISGDTGGAFEDGSPNKDAIQGMVVGGYLNVVCSVGTPVRGGVVYVRTIADAPKAVGDYEATEDISAGGTAAAMVGTGNATSGAVTVADGTPAGAYVALFTAATKFNLVTPGGDLLKEGTTGVAYSAGGLSFTITAGATPAVAGDSITITVADTSKNQVVPNVTWAVDGKDANNIAEIRRS